jgi:hypothetical protein
VTVSFEETVALITGATSGIGKATALSRTTPATSTAPFFPDVPLDLGKQQAAVQRGKVANYPADTPSAACSITMRASSTRELIPSRRKA